MTAKLTRNSTLAASREQVSADLSNDRSEGTVILGLRDGMYFELNDVGARIWHLVQEPRSIQSILETLLEEYDVSNERCEADIYSLADQLLARGLIEVRDETNP